MLEPLTAAALTATLCWSPPAETGLPPADTPAPATEPAAEPVELPEDGRGMITLGGFVLGAGLAALTTTSVTLALADRSSFDSDDRQLYGGLYVLSAVAFTGAGLLIGFGIKRHRRWRSWRAAQPGDIPPQGNGLLAAGAMIVGGGGITTLAGVFSYAGLSLAYTPDGFPDFPYYLMAIGPVVLASGIPMLVIGKRRQNRYVRWTSNYAGTARVSPFVAPVSSPGRRLGWSLGLAGRF